MSALQMQTCNGLLTAISFFCGILLMRIVRDANDFIAVVLEVIQEIVFVWNNRLDW